MNNTLMVTDFAQFYRAIGGSGETRYYPMTANMRPVARAFDAEEDPPVVSGFGAYDTAVSTEYAVGLYSTREMAEAHVVSEPPKAPETAIPDQDAEVLPEDDASETSEADDYSADKSAQKSFKRPRRR